MWTDHSQIETVLRNLVIAEKLAAERACVRPSYTEKLTLVVRYGTSCVTKCWIERVRKPSAISRQH